MAENVIKKFLSKNFFAFKKSTSVIGIDIGSAFLKVVQIKKKHGKAVLETYGELALGPLSGLSVGQATSLSAEKIVPALKDVFKEAGITTKQGALSIPLGASLLSIMDMPTLDNKQLAKMIPIEARKYIPVPINEVTLDWWVVPKEYNRKKKEDSTGSTPSHKKGISVLVVAIHNELIQTYKSIVAKAGLQNTFFELEVFSMSRSTFGTRIAPTMILDMGAGTTKIAVVESGIIKDQHIINRGSQDITRAMSQSLSISIEKAEELKRSVGLSGSESEQNISESVNLVIGHILSEANRVLLNYERRYNKAVKSVVLSGGGALLKGLYEKANEALDTEVVFADPFGKVETPAFLEPVLKDAGPEFAVAVGLALRQLQEIE